MLGIGVSNRMWLPTLMVDRVDDGRLSGVDALKHCDVTAAVS